MATESKTQAPQLRDSKPIARVKGPAGFCSRPAAASIFDQLPPSLYTNPGVIAGCAVFVLLYGLVLFGIMSQEKQRRLETLAWNAQHPRPVEPPPWNPSPPTPEKAPSSGPPSTGQTGESKAATPRPEPKPEPPKPTPEPPNVKPEPPKPQEKSQPPAQESKPKDQPKPLTTQAVALAPKQTVLPPPQPAPAPAPTNTFPPLGGWINPLNDCQFQLDPKGVTVTVPGSTHLLSPELKALSAPRSLVETSSDFTIQVTVVGKIRPGTTPLKGMPVTYQGAGLLLWQDNNNYVRFERAILNSADHPMSHMVMTESCKDGMPGAHSERKVSDHSIALKMERRGDEINCLYTPDGKTWLSLKRFNPTLGAKVFVGLVASNLSPRPLSIRFEDFSLLK